MTTSIHLTASDISRFFGIHRTQARRLLAHYCDITQSADLTFDDLERLNRIIGLARNGKPAVSRYESASAQIFEGVPGIPYVNILWWDHYQGLKELYGSGSVNLTDLWSAMVHYLRLDPDQSQAAFLKRSAEIAERLLGGQTVRHAMLDSLTEQLRLALEEAPDPVSSDPAPAWFHTDTFSITMKIKVLVEFLTASASRVTYGTHPELLTDAETDRLIRGFRVMPSFVLDECQRAFELFKLFLQSQLSARTLRLHHLLTQHRLTSLVLTALECLPLVTEQTPHPQLLDGAGSVSGNPDVAVMTEGEGVLLDLAARLDEAVRLILETGENHVSAFFDGQPPFETMREVFDGVRADAFSGLSSVSSSDLSVLTADVTRLELLVSSWLHGQRASILLPPSREDQVVVPEAVNLQTGSHFGPSGLTESETPHIEFPEQETGHEAPAHGVPSETAPSHQVTRLSLPYEIELSSEGIPELGAPPAFVSPAPGSVQLLPALHLTALDIYAESQILLTICRQIEQRFSRSMHESALKAQAFQETRVISERCSELEQLDAAADLSPEDLTAFLKVGQRIQDLLGALGS